MALVIVVALSGAAVASADPLPTFADSCAADIQPAICERIDYLATEAAQADIQTQHEQDRLDLIWIGVWFAAGVAFGVTVWNRFSPHVRMVGGHSGRA